MSLETNIKAATSTKAQLAAAGLLDAAQASQHAATHTSKLQGFVRKTLPADLPDEPRFFIHSVSEYGEIVNPGAGFKTLFEVKPCPEGKKYGPGCPVKRQYFYEEVKVDVTEFTPLADVQMIDVIMKTGPGMSRDVNRALVGWFVTAHKPGSDEFEKDCEEAHKIYANECMRLVQQADLFFEKKEFNEITDTHKRAAKYLKIAKDWSRPVAQMRDCPRCGEPVKVGAMIHAVPYCGHVFELIPYWKSLLESGQKTLDDAPAEVQEALAPPKKR